MSKRASLPLSLLLSIMLTSCLLVPQATMSRTVANPQYYSCGNANNNMSGHCYGRIAEGLPLSLPLFSGAETDVDVQPLSVAPLLYGSIFNTMWLAEVFTSQCPRACWIEAGYRADRLHGTHLYWADVRPLAGGCGSAKSCGYNEHPGPTLQPADYGHPLHSQIVLASYSTGPIWYIDQYVIGGVTQWRNNTSQNNAMSPNDYQIGEELAGSGTTGISANAPHVNFINNRYVNPLSGAWTPFTNDGTLQGNNPPWAGWNQGHTPSTTPYGGQLYVCIKPYYGQNPC